MTEEIYEISAAQADYGDEQRIVFQVTKALFEDFFSISIEPAQDSSSVISAFAEQCSFGITTLRKLLLRSSKSTLLSLNLCHLVSEYRAYILLKKLDDLENSLGKLQTDHIDSILDDLIVNDKEFRRLLILLEWCEENESSNPKSVKDLDTELAILESSADIRIETLHSRKRGKRLCDLDLDGAKHGRLHGDDEDLQNKVYRSIYMLLKSGRINEACEVLERSGLSALIPSLKFRKFAKDPTLTPKSRENEFFGLAESRALFKKTLNEILSTGDSLSPLESCIWCIVAGKLEPALSLSSRTDERLWCYTNAAVECRIDFRLAEEHGWEINLENALVGKELMVDSIFDEITTAERSPYYSSYRYLLTDDAAGHVDFMKNWLEEHPENLYPHLLRFMVHILLIYFHEERTFNVESAYWILERYTELLVSMNLNSLVPFYASQLLPDRRDYVLILFMYSLEDDESRLEVLAAVHKAGIDTSSLCKKIFAHSLKMNPIMNESGDSDLKLVSAWNWLIFSGKDLIVDALIAANLLLRRFFYYDKLKEAKFLLKQSSENVAVMVENLWSEGFPNQPIPCSLQAHIKEYNAYISYLEALNSFDSWFKQFAQELPAIPEKPPEEVWGRMDMQQKASFELQCKRINETRDRHESNTGFLFKSAYSSLMGVLRHSEGWLNCLSDVHENSDKEQRNMELRSIRERYIDTAITFLQTICEQSNDKQKALNVLDTLADKQYGIAEVLSKKQLRVFVRKFSLFAGLVHG